MAIVTVYRFTTYDGRADEKVTSGRWGTLKGIQAVGGDPLTETAMEVDASLVGGEIEGLTAKGFDPPSNAPSTPTKADEVR